MQQTIDRSYGNINDGLNGNGPPPSSSKLSNGLRQQRYSSSSSSPSPSPKSKYDNDLSHAWMHG